MILITTLKVFIIVQIYRAHKIVDTRMTLIFSYLLPLHI